MENLKLWAKSATKAELRQLAKEADTSKSYLNQLINGHRKASVEKVADICAAANTIRAHASDGVERLPVLLRGDLHPVCARCEYFKAGTCDGK